MTTSKSPKLIAIIALKTASDALPPYRHRFSPKKYTQGQLVACLVLKEFFGMDYRGITALLADMEDLRQVLQLTEVPHYTTLQKASRELLRRKSVHRLMAAILAQATEDKLMRKSVRVAAMDGTGFDSRHVSRYFVERRRTMNAKYDKTAYTRFPKLGLVCDTRTHLVLAGIPEQGPRFDPTHYHEALRDACRQKPIAILLADKMYDAEKHHTYARTLGTRAIIPIWRGRKDALPSTPLRRQLARRFPSKTYHARAQVETVISMLKRHFGAFTRARSFQARGREILLRLFAHNIAVVRLA